MKKVCIFRVTAGRDGYRIFRRFILGVGTVYEVYRGRKHIAGVSRFLNVDEAIETAVSLAKAELYFISDGEDVQ